MHYGTSFIIAFSITAILLFELKPLALRIGLVDQPNNERKHHKGKIPMIGGIAMFCGFMLALLTLDQPLTGLRTLIGGASILIIVGVLDDFHDLSAKIRFIAQIFVGLLMSINGEVILNDLGAIGLNTVPVELGYFLALPLTILAVIMAINAVNMVDGIDGLAGGLSLITISALSFISWKAGLEQMFSILVLLIATVLAFLRFNLRYLGQLRAKVFMGDAGSMFLGFVIVWFLISLSQGEQRAMPPVTVLWIFALPLLDTGTITIRRLLKGKSPFAADREHLHHLLLDTGLTVTKTLLIILGLAICFALIGLLGLYLGVQENIMFWAFIGIFTIYFFISQHYLAQKKLSN
jgi:UDP-GlcNAc:undecaprenyl-phosphate GlcNAc-1-phosphate transferase